MIEITRFSGNSVSAGTSLGTIAFTIGDGLNIIQANTKGYTSRIPYACTIVAVDIAEESAIPIASTTVVDILKGTYASYPTCVSITASAKPTLTSAKTTATDSTLTGWVKTIANTEFLAFNIVSNDKAKKITVTLIIQK